MPERVNSFVPMFPGAIFISLATVVINFNNPARADNACIEQPSQAVEDLHWTVRYDRAKGRRCWFLLDAAGRDVTEAYVRPSAAPTPLADLPNPPRPPGDIPNANKKDNGVRISRRSNGEGQAAKRASQVSIRPEDRALFQEFLQWRERQKTANTSRPQPSTQP
jgi:hypothetical protein